jgi:hypothetical protein
MIKYLVVTNAQYLKYDTRYVTYDSPLFLRLVHNQDCEDCVDSYTCHCTEHESTICRYVCTSNTLSYYFQYLY